MTNGPIEWASDEEKRDDRHTEFGGGPGIVQVGQDRMIHEPTGSEKRGMLVRAQPVTELDPATGLVTVDESAPPVDYVTGAIVDPAWNEDGRTTKPVEAPPRTGDPKSAEL